MSPTAVQSATDEQETPQNLLETMPVGCGMDCNVQLLPFQRSASTNPLYVPTATQAVVVGQETPASSLAVLDGGGAVVWIAQLLPFQRSANSVPADLVAYVIPTAMHRFAVGHDTASRLPWALPPGPVMDSCVHWLPFQRSATRTGGPAPGSRPPTAMQLVVVGHDTALS